MQLIESWLQPLNSPLAFALMMAVWALAMIVVNRRNKVIDECFANFLITYRMTACHHFTGMRDETEWLTFFYFADGYEHAEAIRKGQELPISLSPLSSFFFRELVWSMDRLGEKKEFSLTNIPGCQRIRSLDPICAS